MSSKFVKVVLPMHYVVPADRLDLIEDAKEALYEDLMSAYKHNEVYEWIDVTEAPEATEADVAEFLMANDEEDE